jgi:multicomponent Na+:H+ antiporter subunit B
MSEVVDVVLLILLAVTGVAVIRMRNLFAAVMLTGIYSLVSAGLFVVMDAVDVAFTEAAVGAGISTVLMLGTLALVGYQEAEPARKPVLPLFVVLVTGGILLYGTSEIPPFGDPDNPANHHVAPHYLEESEHEVGHIPNVVTSVLASYRGYDTMGETAVVFTAMVGVLLLLARGPLPRRVYHEGRWITVRPGETRGELEAEIKAGGPVGAEAAPPGGDGSTAAPGGDGQAEEDPRG